MQLTGWVFAGSFKKLSTSIDFIILYINLLKNCVYETTKRPPIFELILSYEIRYNDKFLERECISVQIYRFSFIYWIFLENKKN